MTFQNKSGSIDSEESIGELNSKRNELVAISTRIEELKQEEASYQDRKKEVDSLDGEIRAKKDIKDRLVTEVNDLIVSRDSLSKTFSFETENKKSEIQRIDEEIAYKTNVKNSINNDLDNLRIEIARLDKEKIEKEEVSKGVAQELESTIAAKTIEAESLKTTVDTLRTDINSLISKKEELNKEIIDLNNVKVQKQSEIQKVEDEIATAMRRLDALDKEAEDKITEMKVFEETKKAEYAEIEKRLLERESLVVEKAGWNKEKEEKLKDIKRELEAIHGRKINTVIFDESE